MLDKINEKDKCKTHDQKGDYVRPAAHAKQQLSIKLKINQLDRTVVSRQLSAVRIF